MDESTQIQEWQVVQWADNVIHLAQQMRQTTAGTTRERNGVVGDRVSFDRIGPSEGVEGRRSRFAPTPNVETDESRRWALPIPWVWAKMVDDQDLMRTLHMPMNEYAVTAGASRSRFRDKITVGYDALGTGTFAGLVGGALGLAWEGDEAMVQVPLPTAQIIPDGGAGLTKQKIIRMHSIFEVNEYDSGLHGPKTILYHGHDLNFLLADSSLTSTEFTSVQSLMTGKPAPGLLGFDNWIRYNGLPVEGTIRRNCAYASTAIGYAIWQNEKRRAGERADRSYNMQLFMSQMMGSVRADDKLVVAVDVDTAAPLPA